MLERFAEASSWVRGKRVRVDEGGGYTGVTAGLDARGFLLVDGDDGAATYGAVGWRAGSWIERRTTMLLVLDVGNTNTVIGAVQAGGEAFRLR